jgi:hypothetical protein
VRLPSNAELTTIADGVEDAVGKAGEVSVKESVAGYRLTGGVVDEDDGAGAFEPAFGRDFLFGGCERGGDGLVLRRGAGDLFGDGCGPAVGTAAEDLLVEDGNGY